MVNRSLFANEHDAALTKFYQQATSLSYYVWCSMKAALFICFFISTVAVQAQSHDFVLLKKGNRTVKRLFTGQYFTVAIDGAGPYACLVKEVFKDSLRLMGYSLLNTGTGYGASYIDTVGRYYFNTHYRNITSVYTDRNKNFNQAGSAFTLKAAGVLGVLLTVVNHGSPYFALGSAGLTGLGFLLAKKSTGEMKIGQKYKLVYVQVDG